MFTPLRDVLIMASPLGTTSVVSRGNSPHCNIIECLFEVSLGEDKPVREEKWDPVLCLVSE